VCPYHAIEGGKELGYYRVIEAVCQGCGTCVPECRFGAIDQTHFTEEQIISQIDLALEHEPENKILAFACNWCSYAGADFAGVSRMQYPHNVRIIRTMCSGRVNPAWIQRAFLKGVGAVLVSGCHPADCHYNNANQQTAKRVERFWKRMERLGMNRDRLRLAWVSAAEGAQFAGVIKEMEEGLKKMTPDQIQKDVEKIQESLRKKSNPS
jgi:heterodisulfide reductase subunit A